MAPYKSFLEQVGMEKKKKKPPLFGHVYEKRQHRVQKYAG